MDAVVYGGFHTIFVLFLPFSPKPQRMGHTNRWDRQNEEREVNLHRSLQRSQTNKEHQHSSQSVHYKETT